MRVLFLHNNFPAQFRDLAPALAARPGNEVVFATQEERLSLPGVRKVRWRNSRPPHSDTHPYLRDLERAVLNGQGTYRLATRLRAEGFVPDLVYAHSGWGVGLYMKDVFPEAKFLAYLDWWYRPHGANGDFFPDRPMGVERAGRFAMMNGPIALDLAHADWSVVTTRWQLSQFPEQFHPRMSLLHDGIDTDRFVPNRSMRFRHGDLDLSDATELVTFATRGLDPYRGYPQFLRAVALLLERRPQVHVVIAGEDRTPYGSPPPGGGSWQAYMQAELGLDPARVHHTGGLPQVKMIELLQASSAHVYLSAPFIPSWSMFEAMACGCLLIGSTTPPVRELIQDGHNGLLVDFFDHETLADRLGEALDAGADLDPLRVAARRTIVDTYALRGLLPRQIRLVEDVIAGQRPAEIEASLAGTGADPGTPTGAGAAAGADTGAGGRGR